MAGRDLLADHFASQATNKRQPIDFLEEEPPESLGTAALYALPRIATDLAKGGYNFATQTLPDAYQKAKTEIPGFLNPYEAAKHPLHRAGQVLAGALEQGQNINRWPKNIAEYAANRLNLIPKEWAEKVPVAPDITHAIQNTFGEPQYPGEALARGIGKNFLNLGTTASVLNRLPHLTRKGAASKLNRNQKLMSGEQPLNIKPSLVSDMEQFLPNTDAYRTLLDEATTGDYNKLFNLQSDVGKYSNKLARDWFSAANRNKGKAGRESMNALLDAMHKDMQGKGMLKQSELLRQGRRDYARYMKFKPYRNILGGAAATALGASMLPKNALSNLAEKVVSQYYK